MWFLSWLKLLWEKYASFILSCFASWMQTRMRIYRIGTVSIGKGFPCGSADKESACNAGDLGSIPGLGRSPGRGHDNPLQYSCLENPHSRRSLASYSPWVAKSRIRLSNWAHTHRKERSRTKQRNLEGGSSGGKKIDSQSYTRIYFLYETKPGLA